MDYAEKLDLMDDDCDIEGFPTAQAVSGKWMDTAIGKKVKRCSSCEACYYMDRPQDIKYCPNCGDRMCHESTNHATTGISKS